MSVVGANMYILVHFRC